MCRLFPTRQLLGGALALVGILILASPALAQPGTIKGKVVDGQDQPVESAKVTIVSKASSRTFTLMTDKKGEFMQIGLTSGEYDVTAEKEKLGQQTINTVRVRQGTPANLTFQLVPGASGPTKEEVAKSAALKKAFEEGVAASQGGNYDDAIAKFTQATQESPTCSDCYYNIGYAYSQKKAYAEAEAAFKKAIELKPDNVEAHHGLANIYNAQKRFDEAAAMGAKAAELGSAAGGGGNADALFNQGVILWNAGKIPEAKKQFEDAIKANPDHAESHYQLGMALVNEGKLPEAASEFETYVRLSPSGANAEQAKALIATLKK